MLRKMIFKVSDGAEANPSASKREPKTGKVTTRLTESERVKLPVKVEREGYENPANMPPPCQQKHACMNAGVPSRCIQDFLGGLFQNCLQQGRHRSTTARLNSPNALHPCRRASMRAEARQGRNHRTASSTTQSWP